jgi:beta-glucanase (GH16 family)
MILMLHITVSLSFIALFTEVCTCVEQNPTNYSFNPPSNYELIWQDEFENVGPVQAIINGKPAYAPNPNNWVHAIGSKIDGGIQNYTNSIQNSYVQNGQLTIVAMKEGNTSAMLSSHNLQEFTFGIWAAKIRLPYGQGMWPAWWLVGSGMKYGLSWPTVGEIDILEMVGGTKQVNSTDQYAHATVHWNNQSNTMNPVYNKYTSNFWRTPDGSMLHNNSLVYWTEWTPTNISIGVNEFTYYYLNTTHIPDSINPVIAFSGLWGYFMILNIAFGGKWSGQPDNTTVWPQQMVLDWVRVYQKKTTFVK